MTTDAPREKNEGLFIPEIMCNVISLEYDFINKHARMHLKAHNCTDMLGAIYYCMKVDPEVANIQTFSGEAEDVIYTLSGEEWHSWTRQPPSNGGSIKVGDLPRLFARKKELDERIR